MRIDLTAERADRLDAHVARRIGAVSRRRIAAAVRRGDLRLNGRRVEPSRPLEGGERIEGEVEDPTAEPTPTEGAVDILFEDAEILVVSKPVACSSSRRVTSAGGAWCRACSRGTGPCRASAGRTGRESCTGWTGSSGG